MNNIIGTGTIGQAQLTPEGDKLIINIVTHRSYPKDGAIGHVAAVVRAVYKFRENDEVAQLDISKGSRVGFKGYFTGDFGNNGTANGPHVKETEKGIQCAYEAEATYLCVIGPKLTEEQTYKNFEDVFEVTLWGFLGKKAVLRYTKAATPQAVASTSLAYNLVKYEENVKKELTIWFNLATFGKTAENVMKENPQGGIMWDKGKALIVQGSLLADPQTGGPNIWKKQDGTPAASYELNVAGWCFAPGKRGEAGPDVDRLAASAGASTDEEIPF
jgi:single-strand DNA-binding protein